MSNQRQRERAIERMLRRGVVAPQASTVTAACVDGETLAAWSSGALARDVAARVEDHLADCARCQAMLAAFARTEPVGAASAPWWRNNQVRWLVPLATAATVAAILLAIPQRERIAQPDTVETMPSESRQRAQSQPPESTNPAQPAIESEPAPGRPQVAAPRREGRVAGQEKEQSAATAVESDARAKAEDSSANRLAAAAPPSTPAAAPSAPPPPAVVKESVGAAAATPMFRTAAPTVSFAAPGSTTRWRIVAGEVQRSNAQSESWEGVPLPSGIFAAGHAPSASIIWLVGRAGAIFVSNDAGANFVRVSFISTISAADLVSVVAVDDREATVTTMDGRRFHTSDHGVNWTELF